MTATKHQQATGLPIEAWERPYLVQLGRRLRALRREAAMTQTQLGAAAGLHPVSVRRIELGLRRTRQSTLRRLVLGLGTAPGDVDQLMAELIQLAGPALAPEPEESPWRQREPMEAAT